VTKGDLAAMGITTEAKACDFVLFGTKGDLARRKLLPSLYQPSWIFSGRERNGFLVALLTLPITREQGHFSSLFRC